MHRSAACHAVLRRMANEVDYVPGMRLRNGRYHVEGRHARGGMSVVYRAAQRTGWRRRDTVALKVALPRETSAAQIEAEQRLAHEGILLRLVDHWRVPRALELFAEHDRLHLAMEFVPGATLERLLAPDAMGRALPWPEPRVVALGLALADLLVALHEGPAPILVRDLKPANLIVTPDGHLRLVDLGIACRLRRGQRVPPTERWLGTWGYAAPEQWQGDGDEDERADLYALGAVLYRVATGWLDTGAHDSSRLAPARELNPALSPDLEQLLASLLEPDRARRPARASDVAASLARWEL